MMDGSPDLKNAGPAQTYSGPPDYRVVGRHGVFPETTHDEIARETDTPLGTVKSHIRRGLQRARDLLAARTTHDAGEA
jgi:DNA-directed RNA polymerase specialized sigma24 family protein